MTVQSDIAFLEDFRTRIERFLIVGTAPTRDPLWGGSGLIRMNEAMKDPEFRNLRREINQTKGRAAGILERLGINCTFKQYPPPAVGGTVEKYPLFDLITDNRSHHTIDGSVFTDKIDEAIGRLQDQEARPAEPELGPASPFFIVRDLGDALAFYSQKLGFQIRFATPEVDPFFAIVGRNNAQLMLKTVTVPPLPNSVRDAAARWDAFVFAADPDALAAEFLSNSVTFRLSIEDTEDGLRGFEVADPDGHVLFFGRPQ